MKIKLNGEYREFNKDKMTITELVKELGIKAPNFAVAVGMDIIPKSEYDSFKIKDGDTVEIVTFVGGG